MAQLIKSMVIDGIAASSAIDSSGEVLDIQGLDISDLENGLGVLNYEHRGDKDDGASANDVVGHITYAKKIFDEKDCSNDREREYWEKVGLPFVYIQGELYNGEKHQGAEAVAALIRYYQRRKLPILMRYSIEGSTLEREGNVLKHTLARRVALTLKPCNRTCVSGVLKDDEEDGETTSAEKLEELLRSEDPNRQILGSYELEYRPVVTDATDMLSDALESLREINGLAKALSAGGYGGTAPTNLTGGSALQCEDVSPHKGSALAAYRDWDRRSDFRKFLKMRVPDASPDFVDHFINLIDDYEIKKARALEDELLKAVTGQKTPKTPVIEDTSFDFGANVGKAKAKNPSPPKPMTAPADEEPKLTNLTVRGVALKPNPTQKGLVFDYQKGILHTPFGSLPAYSANQNPKDLKLLNEILNDKDIEKFHNYAMENWGRVHALLKAGKLPSKMVQHAVLLALHSPAKPVPMTEMLYAHTVDAMNKLQMDITHPDSHKVVADLMSRDRTQKWPEKSKDHWKRIGHELTDESGRIHSFMISPGDQSYISNYHLGHQALVDVINRHGINTHGAVDELMTAKLDSKLWDAKRKRHIAAGKGDLGPFPGGEQGAPKITGLGTKTYRYALGMLGAGAGTVNDTHFMRYMFGLDPAHDEHSITWLKLALANDRNHEVMKGIDKWYETNSPVVDNVFNHPKYGHIFAGNKSQALFGAFWKNWMAILPHEAARGITSEGSNTHTDHKPYWEATQEMVDAAHGMGKSEDDINTPLTVRTAALHRDWIKKYGEVPASMMYYAYIVPQLLHEHNREQAIDKMEAAATGLRGLRKDEDKQAEVSAPAVVPPEPKEFHFHGQKVIPGKMELSFGPFKGNGLHVLGADQSHYFVIPSGGNESQINKVARDHEGKLYKITQQPIPVIPRITVKANEHGNPNLNLYPEQDKLIHGLELSHKMDAPDHTQEGITAFKDTAGWYDGNGQFGYVKPNLHDENEMSGPRRDTAFWLASRDFFGTGAHVPVTAAFRHPKTGEEMSVINRVNDAEHMDYGDVHRAIHDSLHDDGTLDRLAATDFILGNPDRHTGNYVLTPDTAPYLHMIDNTRAFWPRRPIIPEFLHNYQEQPWHPQAQSWLHGLNPAVLGDKLLSYGVHPDQVKKSVSRLVYLQQLTKAEPNLAKLQAWRRNTI